MFWVLRPVIYINKDAELFDAVLIDEGYAVSEKFL
jgi:hypothetical protein